jgi:hypothetical protein
MKRSACLLLLSLGIVAPAAAQAPGINLDLRAGVNVTTLGDAPEEGTVTESDLGYFIGGDVRFGKFFFIQPGLYYQQQTVKFENTTLGTSDGIGVSSIMIPLQVGVDVDLKLLGAEIGVGPTLTFNTSVGDNDFDVDKDNLNGTRFGGLVSAKAYVLFIGGFIGYQFDFTEAFKDSDAGGFNQWMLGLGVNF